MIIKTLSTAVLFSFLFQGIIFGENSPEGQKANYTLNRSRERTSAFIKEGKFVATVGNFDNSSKVYPVALDYAFKVLNKNYNGQNNLDLPEEYFSPSFLEKLKKSEVLTYPQYSIRYLGREANQTKGEYANIICDKIEIFDIKQNKINYDDPLIYEEMLGFENLVFNFYVLPQIPVLGAVQLDVRGTYNQMGFRVGFDYTGQATN